MNKDRIIEILEDYEYFVDDDYGGSYQHIDCSQRACTPMGILQILDYIDKLESNWKVLKEWLEKEIKRLEDIQNPKKGIKPYGQEFDNYTLIIGAYSNCLDKMNELKGSTK